jgi:predicted DCC family thiol-disulfide oxidoreductase YuxK
MPPANHLVLLYDGICGLCNWWVRFVSRRDKQDVFRFAPLQSPLATRVLDRHGVNTHLLDTVYLVIDFEERGEHLLSRSDAAIQVLRHVGPPWPWAANIYALLPRTTRDAIYTLIARKRYSLFGRYTSCPLPEPRFRRKFLEL